MDLSCVIKKKKMREKEEKSIRHVISIKTETLLSPEFFSTNKKDKYVWQMDEQGSLVQKGPTNT